MCRPTLQFPQELYRIRYYLQTSIGLHSKAGPKSIDCCYKSRKMYKNMTEFIEDQHRYNLRNVFLLSSPSPIDRRGLYAFQSNTRDKSKGPTHARVLTHVHIHTRSNGFVIVKKIEG